MTTAKLKITEYASEPLRPKLVFEGENEVFDARVEVQCPEAGEVAVHVTRESADDPISSTYYSPADAYVLAERIRTAAWVAEQLGAADA